MISASVEHLVPFSSAPPPLPLTFDRVNYGRAVTSRAPLFSLPLELTHKILMFLHSPQDLANLAQVDADCRQLARSAQFAEVVLDISKSSSWQLLGALGVESWLSGKQQTVQTTSSHQKQTAGPKAVRPGIGICIRKLNVFVDPFANSTASTWFPLPLAGVSRGVLGPPWICGDPSLQPAFISQVVGVLKRLEHLSSLTWCTPADALPIEMISFLHEPSTVRNLQLFAGRSSLPTSCGTMQQRPSANRMACNLESCCLWIDDEESGQMSTITRAILRSNSSTLRHLMLIRPQHDLQTPPPELYSTSLQTLTLYTIPFPLYKGPKITNDFGTKITDLTLGLFYVSPPTTEAIDLGGTPITLPRLRRFRWTNGISFDPSSSQAKSLLIFLQLHPHLEHLEFVLPLAPLFISRLLTLFEVGPHRTNKSTQFSELASLRLIWAAREIPVEHLDQLGSIPNLQHLWISAGIQRCTHCTWMIDHDAILESLQSLSSSLRSLVLTRDVYPAQSHNLIDPERNDYYLHRFLPPSLSFELFLTPDERQELSEPCYTYDLEREVFTDTLDFERMQMKTSELRGVAWERWHASSMKGLAEWYLRGLEALEVVYLGEITFSSKELKVIDVFNLKRDQDNEVIQQYWTNKVCEWMTHRWVER